VNGSVKTVKNKIVNSDVTVNTSKPGFAPCRDAHITNGSGSNTMVNKESIGISEANMRAIKIAVNIAPSVNLFD
jgi:hypothetical protein